MPDKDPVNDGTPVDATEFVSPPISSEIDSVETQNPRNPKHELLDMVFDPEVAAAHGINEHKGQLAKQEERLSIAEARGERVIEIQATVTIRIPEGELVNTGSMGQIYDNVDGIIRTSAAQIYPQMAQELKVKAPEVEEKTRRWTDLLFELQRMTEYGKIKMNRIIKSPTFDLDRAEQIFNELMEIDQQITHTTQSAEGIKKIHLSQLQRAVDSES